MSRPGLFHNFYDLNVTSPRTSDRLEGRAALGLPQRRTHCLVSQPKATLWLAGLKISSCQGTQKAGRGRRPHCKAVENVGAGQGFSTKSAVGAEKVAVRRSELSLSHPAVQGALALKQQAANGGLASCLEALQARPRPSQTLADYGTLLTVDMVSDEALFQMGVQPHLFRSWHQQATGKRPFLHQKLQDFVAAGFDEMYEMDQDPDDFWTLDFEEWGLTKEAAQEAKDILRGDWGYYDVAESIWQGSLMANYHHVVAANAWHR